MATRSEGMKRVKWGTDDGAHIAMKIWVRRDVKNVSTEELSDDELDEILDRLDDEHDASCGITWDIVENAVHDFCYDRTEEANSRKIKKLIGDGVCECPEHENHSGLCGGAYCDCH